MRKYKLAQIFFFSLVKGDRGAATQLNTALTCSSSNNSEIENVLFGTGADLGSTRKQMIHLKTMIPKKICPQSEQHSQSWADGEV